mmetsp:Transcript_10784/g.19559  ORF Transcript_10784/g.19559 Transcript_10784/m.19559 type:complete len:282 (-) Transcript_10784:263-1108(-)
MSWSSSNISLTASSQMEGGGCFPVTSAANACPLNSGHALISTVRSAGMRAKWQQPREVMEHMEMSRKVRLTKNSGTDSRKSSVIAVHMDKDRCFSSRQVYATASRDLFVIPFSLRSSTSSGTEGRGSISCFLFVGICSEWVSATTAHCASHHCRHLSYAKSLMTPSSLICVPRNFKTRNFFERIIGESSSNWRSSKLSQNEKSISFRFMNWLIILFVNEWVRIRFAFLVISGRRWSSVKESRAMARNNVQTLRMVDSCFGDWYKYSNKILEIISLGRILMI